MIGDSFLVSATLLLGFVTGLFGLLLLLAWLEHPETPSWLRRGGPRSRRVVVDRVSVSVARAEDVTGRHGRPTAGVVDLDA